MKRKPFHKRTKRQRKKFAKRYVAAAKHWMQLFGIQESTHA